MVLVKASYKWTSRETMSLEGLIETIMDLNRGLIKKEISLIEW